MAESPTTDFGDLEELGIDLNSDSLTECFLKAANHLQNLTPSLNNDILLNLYALYKQASNGRCNTVKPSLFDRRGRAKWNAWNNLIDMPQDEAKRIYIETIKNLDSNFNIDGKEKWVSVSVPQFAIEHSNKRDLFDFVKDGDQERLIDALNNDHNVNVIDKNGVGLIHWAADRGLDKILEILIENGANIDFQDTAGQTALHYASSCGHVNCVEILLRNAANVNIKDEDGFIAYDLSDDDSVKELFREK